MKSIRAKLIILLLCCVLLSSTIISVICITQTSAILETNAKDNMVLLCEKGARSLNNQLTSIETSVDTLANYVTENLTSTDILMEQDGAAYAQFIAKIKQVGINHASTLDGILAVYVVFDPTVYGSNSGFLYEVSDTNDFSLRSLPELTEGNAYLSESWWTEPAASGKPTWINVYDDAADKLRFSYVVPIYKNGTLLGVIGMDFDGQVLNHIASAIHMKQSGFAVVLDERGHIVYHPKVATGDSLILETDEASAIKEQFFEQNRMAYQSGTYNINDAVCQELFPYTYNDTDFFITFCTLKNGMVLGMNAPVSEVYEQQYVMINRILLFILIVTLTVLVITMVFANHIVNPIVSLNKAARALTEGDFDVQVNAKTKDEIGELAKNFERTRIRMKSYIDELYSEAFIDSLTGTHNKSAYIDEEKHLNDLIDNGTAAFSIATFDVNYLKMTNDLLGHISGDELLKKIAVCLKNAFGPQNVFRTGGDEFAALIYGEDEDERMYRLSQCVAEIKSQSFDHYPDIPISCSVGVATFDPTRDKSVSDTYKRADIMMYKDKAAFKKEVPFWDKDLKGMRDVRIKRYIEFLSILSVTMEAHLFLVDINEEKVYFFNNVNQRFPASSGYYITGTLEDIVAMVHPDDRTPLYNSIKKVMSGEELEHNMNYRWINEDGMPVWVNGHGKVVKNTSGKPSLILGRVSDTMMRKWYNPLTGLFNKTKFAADYRKHEIVPFDRFVLINVDNLSRININRGRKAGDEALLTLANALTKRFSYKVLYHMEKDYFALLLSEQDESDIRRYIKEIQAEVEDSISISVAVIPHEEQYYVDADSIYEYARHLLKANKSKGEGIVSFFTDEDFEKTISDIQLIEELESSIYDDGFSGFKLNYQPQVDAASFQMVSAEALLRYTSATKGPISPSEFIPLLERTQMIREVGTWVLEKSVERCAKWRRVLSDMRVSVNVSPVQLKHEDITDKVLNILRKYDLPANALTLELTECVEIEEAAQFSECFTKLRKAGVHISVDDFGTGYANLGYLNKIQADQLKIDKQLVKNLTPGSLNYTLIQNVVQFAKANSFSICMKGVETVKELSVLEMIGTNVLQGFLFSKPLPVEEFEELYVYSEEPFRWDFKDALAKQREHLRFANFDTMNLLAQTHIGLWMLSIDERTGEGLYYIDEVERQILGMEHVKSHRECYDFFISRVPEEEKAKIKQLLQVMRTDPRVAQLQYYWNHPTRGKILLRCTGKFSGEKDGLLTFEGFERVVEDQLSMYE